MSLIIEDGSVVSGANSFVNDTDFLAFAASAGYTLPTTAAEREALLYKAFLFINSTYEQRLAGVRVSIEQTGIFPRSGCYAYTYEVVSNAIPTDLKMAQMAAALSINNGANVNNSKTDPALSGFKMVGVYEETYQTGDQTVLPEFPAVTRYLKPYTRRANRIGGLGRENMGYVG